MSTTTGKDHRILVTGARAQLAEAIRAEFAGCTTVAFGHGELDIADVAAVTGAVKKFGPTAIINCASYNDVDGAERDPQTALMANTFGVRTLARVAADHGATLMHYSSDFVFDGRGSTPYGEGDSPNPQGVYATSKLLGEWFAIEAPGAFVLRVASLFGGSKAKSSVDRIVDALRDGREAKVFTDRTASPSYIVDVAAASRALLERGAPGLYHAVGSGLCTWYELAVESARILDKDPASALTPILAADLKLLAPRPMYAALSNAKLSATFVMPTWKDALARYIVTKQARV